MKCLIQQDVKSQTKENTGQHKGSAQIKSSSTVEGVGDVRLDKNVKMHQTDQRRSNRHESKK